MSKKANNESVQAARLQLCKRVLECWKTHKKVGMKKKGGRMVPNCVKK